MIVRVRGEVTGGEAQTRAGIALLVRALPSEELLFFTNSHRGGVSLPAAGTFAIEFAVRLHLGAGLYRLQATVEDLERHVDWSRGPSAMIAVEASGLFGGRAHLVPEIRLVEPR